MKILTFFALFFSLSHAFALPELATISSEQLTPGNFWVWSYYEGETNELYSTERYTVKELIDQKVVFEIWTKYAHTREFTPSARVTVDLKKCARAYRSGRQPFSIEMQGISHDQWSEKYSVPATAFEEKFNCNPYDYPALHPVFATVKVSGNTKWGKFAFFQQKPKMPSQILSFYFSDHPKLRGIAYRKNFNANSPYEYAMELVDFFQK